MGNPVRRTWLIVLVLLFSPPAQAADKAIADVAARFQKQVAAISAGADTQARGAAVVKRLGEMGLKPRMEPFGKDGGGGTNMLVELPGTANRTLLLGAHYDRVSVGRGAVDNASGVATLLELLAAFKEKPLRTYNVAAALFDREEVGEIGAKGYVAAHRQSLPAAYANFDVFGYGDTLWVMSRSPESRWANAVKRAGAEGRFPLEIGPEYPPCDYQPFQQAGVETTSFSLLEGKEIKAMRLALRGERPDAMPRVMTLIHTDKDTPDKIDAEAVARAIPVVEQAIRAMDAAQQ
jgi:aminopeptidase S